MSVQDDKEAGQGEDQRTDEGQQTEKPEPDEDAKKKAAEMMTAYEDRPTLVLPGTGGMVSGTAVGDWLDEDGNPKQEGPADKGSDATGSDDSAEPDQDKVEEDKARNAELKEAAAAENKGEKRPR
jgi:hypothetical protein